MDAPAAKNVTIYEINSIADKNYIFNISPETFTGYTGTWFCGDRKPNLPVFIVNDPMLTMKVWDLDHDQDVTGMSVPRSTNVTYRIETNLYQALNYLYRPDANPSDNFFVVKLTDPLGRNIPNIYTGSYGGKNSLILPFENNPFVSSSPFIWNGGNDWDHSARNIQGDVIYPPGTYTFTVSQDLNHMKEVYAAAGLIDTEGKMTSSASVTFDSAPVTTPSSAVTVAPTEPEVTISSPVTPAPPTTLPTTVPVVKKTTYTPLPGWIALLGVGIIGFLTILRRNS
jgi:hypothetical protein